MSGNGVSGSGKRSSFNPNTHLPPDFQDEAHS